MSRRKIKVNNIHKKRPHGNHANTRNQVDFLVQAKRLETREEDNAEVITLITSEELDLENKDYKYLSTIANKLNWSVGRLQKATDRVTKLLKQEAKEKKDE